jgi:hypothetical protein
VALTDRQSSNLALGATIAFFACWGFAVLLWKFGDSPASDGLAALFFIVPLAAFPVVVVFSVRASLRRRARIRSNCCLVCGYSRSAVPNSVACPECGAPSRLR